MDKKKILITGANGQVGNSLQIVLANHPTYEGICCTRKTFDLSNEVQMLQVLKEINPDAIINTAAYTAVDQAEEDLIQAQLVNSEACKFLAIYCEAERIPLVHYSSDYVYHNGLDHPLLESDVLSPKSVYAKTKLEGELQIKKHCSRHFIMRTSWVYDSYGQNFVRTMLALSEKYPTLTVVDDQIGSPTYAIDIAKATIALISTVFGDNFSEPPYGIYNFSNEGVCSWFDFAKAIFELVGRKIDVKPVPSTAFPRPAARPSYSVLDKSKIRSILDYPIPHWRESLADCLKLVHQELNT